MTEAARSLLKLLVVVGCWSRAGALLPLSSSAKIRWPIHGDGLSIGIVVDIRRYISSCRTFGWTNERYNGRTETTCFCTLVSSNANSFPSSALELPQTTNNDTFALVDFTLPETILSRNLRDEIDALVHKRAQARWEGDYETADQLRKQLENGISMPHPSMVLVLEDIPRRLGGGSRWKIQFNILPLRGDDTANDKNKGDKNWLQGNSPSSVLNLAHASLGMVVSASERHSGRLSLNNQAARQTIVRETKRQLGGWYQFQCSMLNGGSSTHEILQRLLEDSKATYDPDDGKNVFGSWMSVETRLRGRKAADAAFWFALAGIEDQEIYDWLTAVVIKELKRFGTRPSCRAKDVMAMVDRLAAAGICSHPELEAVVREVLESKQPGTGHDSKTISTCADALSDQQQQHHHHQLVHLHSENCALMIWKFSARQRKQQSFLQQAARHWETESGAFPLSEQTGNSPPFSKHIHDWNRIFADPSLPLVIDVGCGMGLSLLGLASLGKNEDDHDDDDDDSMTWRNGCRPLCDMKSCNFLGVDLSALAIGYANNIARRWKLTGKLYFTVDDSTRLLQSVAESYPGPVEWVMVQFPTPYRLAAPIGANDDEEEEMEHVVGGNSQLPSSPADGFMVTNELLRQAASVLRRRHQNKDGNAATVGTGLLLLQSNCEDIAIFMRETACDNLGLFKVVETDGHYVTEDHPNPTQRTLSWIAMGGARAIGPGWWPESILPRQGRTETEVVCTIHKTPVHRCILQALPC